ncbi:unnamed protein product [Brassica rapa subsp. narinosa]|uniref:GST N-terminal domain-containing protein n=2 Tax=Brassica oleracea TaxID=3712 RepID=A0A0D3B1B1_BRAOL|nr:unnamed protein product [Brassica oleracea]
MGTTLGVCGISSSKSQGSLLRKTLSSDLVPRSRFTSLKGMFSLYIDIQCVFNPFSLDTESMFPFLHFRHVNIDVPSVASLLMWENLQVREMVGVLDLDILYYPCPRGSPNFRPKVNQMGGKQQFPYMVDPNTGVSMYESDGTIKYMSEKYGRFLLLFKHIPKWLIIIFSFSSLLEIDFLISMFG